MKYFLHNGACLALLILTSFVLISSICKALIIIHHYCIKKYGVECDAVILGIELLKAKSTGSIRRIKLCLQVQPNRGRSYVTECDHIINYSHRQCYETGVRIKVKYDPRCPKKVMLLKN